MKKSMSLTKEQLQDLEQLSTYFEKIEQLAAKNGIDLDVFMSEYKDDSYAVYATEKVEMPAKTTSRKKIFEKAGKDKSVVKTSATRSSL
jgi:hypothetical protein